STAEFRTNPEGRIIEERKPGPNATVNRWTFTYEDSRLSSITEPGLYARDVISSDSSVAVVADDAQGTALIKDATADIPKGEIPTSNAQSATVEVNADALKVTSAAGNTTEFQYDKFGRLLRSLRPDGASLRMSRDEAGRLSSICVENTSECFTYVYKKVVAGTQSDPYSGQALVSRTDPSGRITRFGYNTQGNLTTRYDANGGISRFIHITEGIAAGLPESIINSDARRTNFQYDNNGNILRIEQVGDDAGASATLLTEILRNGAGYMTRVTEPSGRVMNYEVDLWGEVTKRTIGTLNTSSTLDIDRVETLSFSPLAASPNASLATLIQDDENRQWSAQYNSRWLPTTLGDPASGLKELQYDADGVLSQTRFADSSTETLSYDDGGRITQRLFGGAAAGASLDYDYDSNGLLTTLTSPELKELREYEPGFGWIQLTVTPQGSTPADAAFTVQRNRVLPDVFQQTLGESKFTIRRGFDDKVESVEHVFNNDSASQKTLLQIERSDSGQLLRIVRGNGTETRYYADTLGRIIRQEEDDSVQTTTFEWTWDADHPLQRSTVGETIDYEWDEQGRILLCGDSSATFSWNHSNEHSVFNGTTSERNAQGQLTYDGSYDYTYDTLGRRLSRNSRVDSNDRETYAWGAGGKLSSVSMGPVGSQIEVAAYHYDGQGRIIAIENGTSTTRIGYLPDSDRVVRMLDTNGIQWHVASALMHAAYSVAIAEDGSERYTHLDPYGRLLGFSDESGVIEFTHEECFGLRESPNILGGPNVALHGLLVDPFTRLLHSNARPYDPAIGEFLTPDPLSMQAAPLSYGYTGGNPVLSQDNSGKLLGVFMAATLTGAFVFNEIRKFAQSKDVIKTRESYKRTTDVATDDSALKVAEKAHKRLARSAKKGGQTALKATKKAYDAILNPAENGKDLAEGAKDLAESLMDEGAEGDHQAKVEE
ncbi:hypothetical protein KAI87_14675, partial [Myxococcota bacterium]|nr:hypothetical protein [Myxococcota bacterium]